MNILTNKAQDMNKIYSNHIEDWPMPKGAMM